MPLSAEEQERQRIARLRQQQVSARDPGPSKIRGYDWSVHAAKGRQMRKNRKPFLIELVEILPGRWKGVLLGLIVSLLPTLAIAAAAPPEMALLALLPPLLFGIGGYVIGIVLQDKTPY
ncbi:MAG: hypothetical protein JNL42_02595 [Anaerolineae bacterium]|nr:hypothetical protein [Anaerolineae bacterium]